MEKSSATINDIAKLADVALSTVSKYLNGKVVRESSKIKIEKALQSLDYRPNEAARSLKTKKTMTIGILIPYLQGHFDTTIVSIVEEILANHNYSVIICTYRRNTDLELEKLTFLFNKRVDGLIIIPSEVTHEIFYNFIAENRPIVCIDRPLLGIRSDAVIIDNSIASYLATSHLLSLGHTKIACIMGEQGSYTAQKRIEGYAKALTEYNIPFENELVSIGKWSIESAEERAAELLKKRRDVSAIIAGSDELGYGVVKALQDAHIFFPQNISFVSFDMYKVASLLRPSVTTISQPVKEIGITAAQLLLNRLTRHAYIRNENQLIYLQPILEIRESTIAFQDRKDT